MTFVYCFSGSGHSMAVADFFAEKLNSGVKLICKELANQELQCQTAVVVFPVYCQNIPNPVKDFLKELDSKHIVLIVTYGKISYGNVLYQAKKLVSGKVIAGAYIPTGHAFLKENFEFNLNALFPIFDRIEHPKIAKIPKSSKNIFAGFFPSWRSRIGVKIIKTSACNSCNICGKNCPMGAINKGNINSKCIRCLRCVSNCPKDAIAFENRSILKRYLENHHKDEVKVYL